MTFWTSIGGQLQHPSGRVGALAGRVMRLANARPNAIAVEALCLRPSDHVLELGCGPGYGVQLTAARTRQGVVHAVDQSTTMLTQAHARNRRAVCAGRVNLHQSAFEDLPLPDNSIDKVLAVNVAYFWGNAETVLREVHRVLRPGGMIAIYVTEKVSMERWKFAGRATHRHFDRLTLVRELLHNGFGAASISVTHVRVAWGITGLLALAWRAA